MIMHKRIFLIVFILAAISFQLAQGADKEKKKPVDISKLPPALEKKDLSYDKDIKPILEKSCVKCHSGDKPKSKYRMDSRESTIKGGESGDAAIIPGKS